MSEVFSTEEFLNQVASWQNRVSDPNAALGTARGLGSVWDRSDGSIGPSDPLETFFKLNSTNTGWALENLVNLRVFNVVRDFGAVADGVTDCVTPIRNAIAAADAAGGGIIYFPPSSAGYAVFRVVGSESLMPLDNRQNIILMGDGYNSWFKWSGNSGATTQEMFRVFDLSQRIVFFNLRFNSDALTNFIDQTHFIQFSQSNPPVVNANPFDMLVKDCWFDPVAGDSIRLLGGNGAGAAGFIVHQVRVMHNSFNTSATSRSCVSTQRDVDEVLIQYNWMNQTVAQCIDFEPAIGQGPSRFDIIGNILTQIAASANIAITLSGVSNVAQSNQVNCSFNIITNGGTIQAVNPNQHNLISNIIDIQETSAGEAGISLRNPNSVNVEANIISAENIIPGGFERPAIWYFSDAPGSLTKLTISNNVFRAIATVNGNSTIRMEDTEQISISGNLVFMDVDTAVSTWTCIIVRALAFVGEDWQVVGNLCIGTRDRLTDAIEIDTENGVEIHNVIVNDNYTRNSLQGIRFAQVGAGSNYTQNRACTGNNTTDATIALTLPPSINNNGVVNNGNAGPCSQIATFNASGSPETRVTAVPGSLVTNSSGVAGQVVWTKDSGTAATGWAAVGAVEFVFGALSGSVATANRFFAPGAGAATEDTVQIDIAMPRVGSIRNMRLRCVAGVGGGTNTYTMLKNSVATAQTFNIANTATAGGPIATGVTVAAGDLISVRVSKSAVPGTPQTLIVITFELTG